MQALIIKSDKRVFTCRCDNDAEVLTATALGNLLKGRETLVVGDKVILEQRGSEWIISEALPRDNEIFRLLVRERKKKIIAANCDRMVIVMSVSKPAYKRGLVDRYLVRAHQWGIRPILVLNKMDEHNSDEKDIKIEAKRLKSLGVETFEVSALDKDYQKNFLASGLEELEKDLSGKTSIFLGHSGVGKSQLITALSSGEVELKSAEIAKSGKGSHTTTWAEIVSCGNLQIIDSPGVRSYSLEDIDPRALLEFFPDLEEIAVNCKFNDCHHNPRSKGCAFHDKWSGTEEERELILTRLDSYKRLFEELSEIPQWKKSF